MKRYIAAVLAGITLLCIPATASASGGQPGWHGCPGYTSGLTPADVGFTLDRYSGFKMKCSSVRYAANQLRRRMEHTRYANPNVSFYDGYVRWHCGAFDGGIDCDEYTSNTSFEVHFYRW